MNSTTFLSSTTLLATGFLQAASADGYFLQTDVGGRSQSFVASTSRGPLSFGLNLSNYEDGRSGAISATYAFPVEGVATFKLGPTVGFKRDDDGTRDTKAGARLAVDRWTATSFGSAYALAEASTVHRSWFLLGQVTFAPANIGIELSRGGSDDYHETTLAVQKRLGDGPVSLRLGYKLSSEELFAGFSINTF